MKSKWIGQLVTVALIAIFFQVELKALFGVIMMQGMLYANNHFFLSLFYDGFTRPSPYVPNLDMGSSNLLKLKLTYVLRYLCSDQFLFQDTVNGILKEIEMKLESQYQANGWNSSSFESIPVPTFDWKDISADQFHEQFVVPGVPVVLKNVPSVSTELWSPEFFSEEYGSHELDVINVNSLSTLRMNFSRYVAAHSLTVLLPSSPASCLTCPSLRETPREEMTFGTFAP
jgi:hypothetical protein